MVYAYKASTQEAEAAGRQVQGQVGLYSKIYLKKTTRKNIFKTKKGQSIFSTLNYKLIF